jgi:hypothetical protein
LIGWNSPGCICFPSGLALRYRNLLDGCRSLHDISPALKHESDPVIVACEKAAEPNVSPYLSETYWTTTRCWLSSRRKYQKWRR